MKDATDARPSHLPPSQHFRIIGASRLFSTRQNPCYVSYINSSQRIGVHHRTPTLPLGAACMGALES